MREFSAGAAAGSWRSGSRSSSAALPFAARQTEHLTGGGFDVPGSQSKAVSEALQKDFGAKADGIAVLLQGRARRRPGAARGAAVGRVRREVATIDGVTLPPAAAARGAPRSSSATGIALLPLRSDQSVRRADRLGDDPARRPRPGHAPTAGVTPYLVGQPTIWAGMQEISKRDLAQAEASGFPIVALILLVVFGSLAAAALPLALGFVSVLVTGALIYFISLQMTTSVFVTNMASMIGIGVAIDYSLFILARYREEREAGREPRRGAGRGALDLGPRGHLLRARGDHLAGRPLDGRQPGAALDGAGGDDRRRRLDPDRDDAAAGADRDARRPRPAGRHRRPGRALLQAPRLPPASREPQPRPPTGASRFWEAGRGG